MKWLFGFVVVCMMAAVSAQAQVAGRFPPLAVANLNGDVRNFPSQLDAPKAVIILAFEREHQRQVDTWVPYLNQINASQDYGPLPYYELPTVGNFSAAGKFWLDNVMRVGIPDPQVRAKVYTVYEQTDGMLASLQISRRDTIYVLLVDQAGRVLWRATGPVSTSKRDSLLAALLR